MASEFTGFSQQGLHFLQQVRIENYKEWFEANRGVYEREVLTPFRLLVDALSPVMLMIDPQFETRPAIGKTLSRIHRDTRFSHDKSRYRSHMWLTFKRPSKDWRSISLSWGRTCCVTASGYYSANKPTMDLFRYTLLRRPQPFLDVVACSRAPFELVGESYKRPLVKRKSPSGITASLLR